MSWMCHLFNLVKWENVYFICGFPTHEIRIFSFPRLNIIINLMAYSWQNLNILYILAIYSTVPLKPYISDL